MRRISNATPGHAARAFLMMDLLLAISIAGALLLSLTVAVGTLRRAERQMADTRAASRRLEQAFLTLQSGGAADPDLQIERLGNGPADRVWVRLSLRPDTPAARPTRAALVGLVPAGKAPGGVP